MAEKAEPGLVQVAPVDRPVRATGVASVELDGEVVLLDETGHVHLLNPTAGLLWACFGGRVTVNEIAADAADAFHMTYEAVLADVCTFTTEMASLGLVVILPTER